MPTQQKNYRWFGVATGALLLTVMFLKVPLEDQFGYSPIFYSLLFLLALNIASIVLMAKNANWKVGFAQSCLIILLLLSIWFPWNSYLFLGKEIAHSENAKDFGWESVRLYEKRIVLENGGVLGWGTRMYSDYEISDSIIWLKNSRLPLSSSIKINGKTYQFRSEYYR